MNYADTTYLFLIVFGIFAVTFPVRFVPLLTCNRLKIPPFLKTWLAYVPVSIFAALLTQVFYQPGKEIESFVKEWQLLVACAASLAVTLKTKSVGWGVGLGFSAFLVLYFAFA